MSRVFGSIYADAYDALYHDKDYSTECELIARIFQTYGDGRIRSVLDLGCGTGNHALLLAERGYEIVGVDRSENMLRQLSKRTAGLSRMNGLVIHQADIRNFELDRHFDASLMMFSVLGYQIENADVRSVLCSARRHLRLGGLLIFDVWYGPAVLCQRPSQRVKVVPTTTGQILRIASGDLDSFRHISTVQYHLWRIEEQRVVAETMENHSMRYFFPMELDFFLEGSDFALIRLGAFPEFDQDPDETTWNVLAVARAV